MRNKSEITNWILLIMWMVFIYMMSNQPATVSDAQSGGVILFLSKIGTVSYSHLTLATSDAVKHLVGSLPLK